MEKLVLKGSVGNFPARASFSLLNEDERKKEKLVVSYEKNTDSFIVTHKGDTIGFVAIDEEFEKEINSLKQGNKISYSYESTHQNGRFFNLIPYVETEQKKESVSSNVLAIAKKQASIVGMPESEAERIVSLLTQYGLATGQQKKVIGSWVKPHEDVAHLIPSTDKIIFIDGPKREFFRAIGYAACDQMKAFRLVGSMSTGKNVFIESLAGLMYKPLLEVDMQRNTEAEDFEGRDTLSYKEFKSPTSKVEGEIVKNSNISEETEILAKAILEAGLEKPQVVQTIEFVKQPLVIAMETGSWVNFNELNFAQAYVLARLHRVLDTRSSLAVPSLGDIKAADGFALMATMNPPKKEFIGTSYMNEALETRFLTMWLDPRTDIASVLKAKYPTAKITDINLLNRVYKEVYKQYELGLLSEAFLAIRRYEAALTQRGFGTLADSIKDHLGHVSCNQEDAQNIMEDILGLLI